VTDLADLPPHFWIEPGLDGVIVATEAAAEQARALGLDAAAIARVSGMILHPRFYSAAEPGRRERVRGELQIGPLAFTASLPFGGKGSPEMLPLAEALLRENEALRVIAICGDNPSLFESLAPLDAQSGGRLLRYGYTDKVAELLAASDLLVSKPGPGSLAEAFHQRVPVVVTRNIHTIPQERFNTELVAREGLGVVVSSWREIPDAVNRLAREPDRLRVMRASLEALPPNRAVYEVLDAVAREAAESSSRQ
jgi:1,2-diacylglycerol 3-beta-galactosyltransferase